jgi:hypothetical protein
MKGEILHCRESNEDLPARSLRLFKLVVKTAAIDLQAEVQALGQSPPDGHSVRQGGVETREMMSLAWTKLAFSESSEGSRCTDWEHGPELAAAKGRRSVVVTSRTPCVTLHFPCTRNSARFCSHVS